jgi:hypothetical protein
MLSITGCAITFWFAHSKTYYTPWITSIPLANNNGGFLVQLSPRKRHVGLSPHGTILQASKVVLAHNSTRMYTDL